MRAFAEWILLLQVDSDDDPGTMWGDAGRLYFMIRKSDLREARFHDVRLAVDCY